MTGTLSLRDLYGSFPPANTRTAEDNKTTVQASGGINDSNGPAMSWVGIVILLVIIRLLHERKGGI